MEELSKTQSEGTDRLLEFDLSAELKHGIAVSNLVYALATELGLPHEQCYDLAIAGMLHDIGKLKLRSYINGQEKNPLVIEELKYVRMHSTLGYEEHYLTAEEYFHYDEKLNAKLVPFHKPIYAFRGTKEDWELELMRKAQAITDRAFAEVITRIKPGMTELELQAELIYCMYKNGGTGLAFDPIVVSGPNTSLPHGVAGERVIQKGDFVTMDFGASYMGYCSDMTRTVAVGYATDEMKHVYDTVLKAQLTAIAATKAGVPGKEIDGVARKVIADAGYGEYFGHGYGHSLGLEIHENPSPNASNVEPLPAGVVCSAEPGIYLPGKFGVRIEDVTIITENGCEDVTGSPKNLIIL